MIIFFFFCHKPFIIFIHGIGNFIGNVTSEKCQFLFKSCYSVEYNKLRFVQTASYQLVGGLSWSMGSSIFACPRRRSCSPTNNSTDKDTVVVWWMSSCNTWTRRCQRHLCSQKNTRVAVGWKRDNYNIYYPSSLHRHSIRTNREVDCKWLTDSCSTGTLESQWYGNNPGHRLLTRG